MVGAAGEISKVPFSRGSFHIGATPDLGIVSGKRGPTDGSPMKAYDVSSKKKWIAFE